MRRFRRRGRESPKAANEIAWEDTVGWLFSPWKFSQQILKAKLLPFAYREKQVDQNA